MRDIICKKVIINLSKLIEDNGGILVIVGGYVRDLFFNIFSKDIDAEVFFLSLKKLEEILKNNNIHYKLVGLSFSVLKISIDNLNIDLAFPRKEKKVGLGHRGFLVEVCPFLTFKESAFRRDFTMNSIGLIPSLDIILDPFNGIHSIKKRFLKIVNSETFVEDPLRLLRAAVLISKHNLKTSKRLVKVCREINNSINEISIERIAIEIKKMLLSKYLFRGISFIRSINLNFNFRHIFLIKSLLEIKVKGISLFYLYTNQTIESKIAFLLFRYNRECFLNEIKLLGLKYIRINTLYLYNIFSMYFNNESRKIEIYLIHNKINTSDFVEKYNLSFLSSQKTLDKKDKKPEIKNLILKLKGSYWKQKGLIGVNISKAVNIIEYNYILEGKILESSDILYRLKNDKQLG